MYDDLFVKFIQRTVVPPKQWMNWEHRRQGKTRRRQRDTGGTVAVEFAQLNCFNDGCNTW